MRGQKKDEAIEPERPIMDFSSFLEELASGDVNRYLGEKLSEVVAAVKEFQKVGKLKIEISVKPEAHLAKIDVATKVELPQPPLPGSIMFFRGDTALSKEDPRQLVINLRDLKPAKADEVRDADGPARTVRDTDNRNQ